MSDNKNSNKKPEKVICVFCGSSSGNDEAYMKQTDLLGDQMVKKNWGLVYGGGTKGLMGAIAKGVSTRGGSVHGIIPRALIERERQGDLPEEELYGKTTVVEDMHTRKRLMAQESEAFVALPGGYGTAEELFEVVTWNQLGIHSRPIVLLNIDGFYDGLVDWINKAVSSGFVSAGNKQIVVSVNTAEEVIEAIENYKVAEGRYHLDWNAQSPIKTSN